MSSLAITLSSGVFWRELPFWIVIWKVPEREFSHPEGGSDEGTTMPVTGKSVAGRAEVDLD